MEEFCQGIYPGNGACWSHECVMGNTCVRRLTQKNFVICNMKHVCNREELKNKMLAVEQLVATGKSTEDACDICKIKIAVYL